MQNQNTEHEAVTTASSRYSTTTALWKEDLGWESRRTQNMILLLLCDVVMLYALAISTYVYMAHTENQYIAHTKNPAIMHCSL